MKTKLSFLIISIIILALLATCKKKNSDTGGGGGANNWHILVTTPGGDTIAVATGAFTFTQNNFSVQITTSVIGGGHIIKQFQLSGARAGDSIFVNKDTLNLTDPVETVIVNGRVKIYDNVLSGNGTYTIMEPPDTTHITGPFVVTGINLLPAELKK